MSYYDGRCRHGYHPPSCIECADVRVPAPPPAQGEAPRVTAIVNGQDVEVATNERETLGVLAHRVLAAEGYSWLTVEIRDERGLPCGAREHAVMYAGKRIWISPSIGHGG